MLNILKCLFLFPLLAHSSTVPGRNNVECPESYEKNILIIMSMDGFRPDYLNRGLTPTLQSLKDEGVYTPYMLSSFPTVTFPNHYSIVTGLYPESHGIIANSFNDTVFNEEFSSSNTGGDGKWFGGEPVWNTVMKNGMKSAAYFWVGSEAEIGGLRPDYYYTYDHDDPFEGRIDKVLEWLVLPIEDRPTWISVYFHEPDSAGHEYGPISPELDVQLERMDLLVLQLVEGIASLGLANCVNLLIVSDHGMAHGGEDRVIPLDEYEPNLDEKSDYYLGAITRIRMKDAFEAEPLMESLTCKNDHMRQFDRKSLPKRYHFSNNPNRIEDIILGLDAGYTTNFGSPYYLQGYHGYDNKYLEMQSLFLAYGPDFKTQTVIEPFENIEIYNLMCDLLAIEPAPNNGTKGALYHIMANPPAYPSALPVGASPESAIFPGEADLLNRLRTSGCSGDLSSTEDWLYELDIDETEQEALNEIHMPFGAPIYATSISSSVTLLYHNDHITGFSQTLKMPIWTSFTLTTARTGSPETQWCSDVRLTVTDSRTCSDYESLTNYSMKPLFVPDHSEDEDLDRIPFMISNALPMTADLSDRYNELMTELVPIWQGLHGGPINIVAGPVFDSDFDSLVDEFPENDQTTSVVVPSEIFLIVMKCSSVSIEDLRECAISDLQVSGFIYTQTQTVANCLDRESYAKEFSALVKDISLSTGLVFNTDLSYQESISLALRSDLDLWPTRQKYTESPNGSQSLHRHFLSYLAVILSIVYFSIDSM